MSAATIQAVPDLPYDIDGIIDNDVFGACPFIRDGPDEWLIDRDYIGPDECEMDAQLYSFLAEGVQARRLRSRATPIMAVTAGLSPSDHFLAGLHAPSPLEQDRRDIELIIELRHL